MLYRFRDTAISRSSFILFAIEISQSASSWLPTYYWLGQNHIQDGDTVVHYMVIRERQRIVTKCAVENGSLCIAARHANDRCISLGWLSCGSQL